MKNFKIYLLITFALIGLSANAQTAYIVNYGSNNVSVINLTTNTVTGTIPVGANPDAIAISPDGSKAYVANYDVNGTVSVINTATNTVIATITVGTDPYAVAVSPDGSQVYVSNWSDGTLSVINAATNTVSATCLLPNNCLPLCIAVSPNGNNIYVTTGGYPQLIVVNSVTHFTTAMIGYVGTYPDGVCVSPDGAKVYVTNQTMDSKVFVIDTLTNTVIDSIPVGNVTLPSLICISPDGTKLYVSLLHDSTVRVINTSTNTVSAIISVVGEPEGISVSPDGALVYVAINNDNSLSVINTTTNTVTDIIPVGTNPISVGNFISPLNTACSAQFLLYADTTQAHHYFINNNAFGVQPLHYLWNWGDGNTDTIPYPSHTYLDSGVYTICLTITDSTGCQSIFCDSSYHIMRTSDYMVTINVISNIMTDIKHIVANNTISVYPNPASSTITIHQSTPSPNQQLLITNILGEEIYHQAINNSTQTTIDISHWSNGVYFYQIRGDKETVQGKFVKEK